MQRFLTNDDILKKFIINKDDASHSDFKKGDCVIFIGGKDMDMFVHSDFRLDDFDEIIYWHVSEKHLNEFPIKARA